MKHSLPLGCSQAARSPQPCLGTAMQTRKTGREGATCWHLRPSPFVVKSTPGPTPGAQPGRSMRSKHGRVAHTHTSRYLPSTHTRPATGGAPDRQTGRKSGTRSPHSALQPDRGGSSFQPAVFPNTVRGRTGNGLSQKITFLLNPPVATSERGMLPWGLSEPCPPLPPSKTVKVMSCCF